MTSILPPLSDLPSSAPHSKRPRTQEEAEDEIAGLRAEVESLKVTVDLLLKEVAALKASTPASVPSQPSPSRPSYREALGEAPRSAPPIPPSDGWTEVPRSKKPLKKTPKMPESSTRTSSTKTPARSSKETRRSLKDSLEGLSATQKLKVLLRSPRTEEDRTTLVDIVTVALPLSMKAQSQPMTAWKQALQEITGHQPLLISLIHPCRAEVFFDAKVSTQARETLSQQGYLQDPVAFEERDLVRRKRAYLSGYFLPLRRATLQGLDPTQQMQILQLAETDLATRMSDPATRKQWMFQIKKDREWLQHIMQE